MALAKRVEINETDDPCNVGTKPVYAQAEPPVRTSVDFSFILCSALLSSPTLILVTLT